MQVVCQDAEERRHPTVPGGRRGGESPVTVDQQPCVSADRAAGANSEIPLKPREQPRGEDGRAPEWCSPLQRLRATEQKSAPQAR